MCTYVLLFSYIPICIYCYITHMSQIHLYVHLVCPVKDIPIIIIGVTIDGNKEEFVNESHTLTDLELFTPLLKLVERQGDLKEKVNYNKY